MKPGAAHRQVLPGVDFWRRNARTIWRRELARHFRLARGKLHARQTRGFDRLPIERYFVIVGHPRSGSTLLAALLDAHPAIGVAHEGEILGAAVNGGSRHELLARTHYHCTEFRRRGRHWEGYDYRVGDHQGLPEGCRVLGDKTAGRNSDLLAEHPDALNILEETLEVPVCAVVLERNPLDVVATMLRKGGWREGGSCSDELDAFARHRARIDALTALEARHTEQTRVVHHAELCHNPTQVVAGLVETLGVTTTDSYLDRVTDAVDGQLSRPSLERQWAAETLNAAKAVCAGTARLGRYLPELNELSARPTGRA